MVVIEVVPLSAAVDRGWMLSMSLALCETFAAIPISLSTFERATFYVTSVVTGAYHSVLGFLADVFDMIPAHHRRRQLRLYETSDWQGQGPARRVVST
ncbi:hypothetical protein PAXRUDRAFT_831850 [Paxillus rubicundulus Ve08.2h10]|uniref:Uncharacterized protein n=1 Tax=Paxillus rubicundulus Ve08.2h10 TaxID=930991 RepID=A0A0D0DMR8_9AGAM|nr:hypothetical protein PAXRUDRAFT_831850 [Paxillus rubicundulus Ve08.2h10]